MRFEKTTFVVEIKQANGDVNYRQCMRQAYTDPFRPHFGLVASNVNAINDVDILGIYLKNMDFGAYQDKAALEEEKMKLLL